MKEPRRVLRPRLLSILAVVAAPLLFGTTAFGVEPNTDRPGSDFKRISLGAAFCEAECNNDPNCKAWTYVRPGTIQGPDGTCWLKAAVPPPVKDTCCISGVKSSLPPISTQGDLAAWDWCYSLNENIGKITFYPIVKNVGPTAWASAKEGYYKIGVGVGSTIIEETHPLSAFPYWWLEKGAASTLSPGQTRDFSKTSTYTLKNLWLLHHVEDTNSANDYFQGPAVQVLGQEFVPGGTMNGKTCKD